jgi:hypothetical protein
MGQAKTAFVGVKMTPGQVRELRLLAVAEQATPSEVVRRAIEARAEATIRQKPPASGGAR